jgi:hypothetical protein
MPSLLASALQRFKKLLIVDHRNNVYFHQVAPHQSEFSQGLGIVALQQVIWLRGLYLEQPEEWDDPHRFLDGSLGFCGFCGFCSQS